MNAGAGYRCRAFLAAFLAIAVVSVGATAPAPIEPPGWLVEPPNRSARLSPDGRRLAWARGDRIASATIEAMATPRWTLLGGDVVGLAWAGDSALVARVVDQRLERLVHVPVERPAQRRTVLGVPRADRARLRVLSARSDALIVSSDDRIPYAPDLLRIALPGGTVETYERNPGRVFRWVLDARQRAAAAQAWEPGGHGVRYLWLARSGASWYPARRFRLDEPLESVLRVTDQGWLLSRQAAAGDSPGESLSWFDPRTRRSEPVWAEDGGRITAVFDAEPGLAPGLIALEDRRPRLVSTSPEWAGRLTAVAAGFPDASVALAGRGGGDSVLLWRLISADRPDRFLLQVEGGFPTPVLAARPGYGTANGIVRTGFTTAARDGLQLTGYLTRPAGAGPLPGVLLVHGGPWARDSWGFHAEAAFLATLGHAVVQVNFRGSTGHGRDHLLAGRGEWGLAMQDDLEDAIAHAVAAGWVAADRVCIMGASYGGYAALMAALRPAGPFRCVVARAPVTDLPAHLATMRAAGNDRGYLEWREMVGAAGTLAARSPLLASGLDRPVLLGFGTADRVVQPAQARRFAARFPSQVTSVPLHRAGHVLRGPEVRRSWYGAVARFLAEELGSVPNASAGPVAAAGTPLQSAPLER